MFSPLCLYLTAFRKLRFSGQKKITQPRTHSVISVSFSLTNNYNGIMSLYTLLLYFMIYSCMGWVLEVVYHAVSFGKVVNRGFLNGPLCPVYGFGAAAILLADGYFPLRNPLALFLCGSCFATLIELAAGWILDRMFHARWWDYSDLPLNLHGYICLKFSILWGVAILVGMRVIHPPVAHLISDVLPSSAGWILILVSYAFLSADVWITIAFLLGLNRTFRALDHARNAMRSVSDSVSTQIGTDVIEKNHEFQLKKEQAEAFRAELKDAAAEKRSRFLLAEKTAQEKLKREAERLELDLLEQNAFRRILLANPDYRNRDYPELLQDLKQKVQKQLAPQSEKPSRQD